MTQDLIKNIAKARIFTLAEQVEYAEQQVVSRTLVQNSALTLTLFAFAAGEGLSTHTTPGDALVQVLEGTARITIGGTEHQLEAGQSIVMPADIPHAVDADQAFKMLLTLVKGLPE